MLSEIVVGDSELVLILEESFYTSRQRLSDWICELLEICYLIIKGSITGILYFCTCNMDLRY